MKIGNKIFLSFLAILLVYAAFFVAREYMLSAIRDEFSNILPLSDQSLILSEQINSINSLESEINSYIVIGSEGLKTTIQDYPEEFSLKISAFIEDEKTREEFGMALLELDENISSLIKINEQPENKSDVNNQILRVYESIDKLKKLEKGLLEHRTDELREIIKNQEETTSWITKLSLFSGVFIFIIGFFLSYLLSRGITKSITRLRDAAKKISEGKLDTKIEIKSEDEIGQLATAFNEMATELKESYSGLEQKVFERTKELEVAKKTLEEKLNDLEKMNELMIGRELKMIELKKAIEELKNKGD
ncbi:HAMP domain-containing protein [Patescibacteria group bacterium]|nr:HAMP domain-containing protein [Patescibacteria group bacterium]